MISWQNSRRMTGFTFGSATCRAQLEKRMRQGNSWARPKSGDGFMARSRRRALRSLEVGGVCPLATSVDSPRGMSASDQIYTATPLRDIVRAVPFFLSGSFPAEDRSTEVAVPSLCGLRLMGRTRSVAVAGSDELPNGIFVRIHSNGVPVFVAGQLRSGVTSNVSEGLKERASSVLLLQTEEHDAFEDLFHQPWWSPRARHVVVLPTTAAGAGSVSEGALPEGEEVMEVVEEAVDVLELLGAGDAWVIAPGRGIFALRPPRVVSGCGRIVRVGHCTQDGEPKAAAWATEAEVGGPLSAAADLQGCHLHATVVPWNPFIIEGNQTLEPGSPISPPYEEGFEVQLLKVLQQRMNFNVTYRLPDPNNLFGQIGDLMLRRADIMLGCIGFFAEFHDLLDASVSYQKETYRWFVPARSPVPRWKSITLQFQPDLWLAVFFTFIAAATTLALTKRPPGHGSWARGGRWSWASYHALVLLLGGAGPDPGSRAERAWLAAWLAGCLVLGAAYKSSLVGFLADPGLEPQLRDLGELLSSGLRLGVLASLSSFLTQMTDDPRYAHVVAMYENCTHLPECLSRAAFARDMALPAQESRVQFDAPRLYTSRADGRALLEPLPEPVLATNVGMYFRRGSALRPRVDTLLQRLLQGGLPAHWWRDLNLAPLQPPSRPSGRTPPPRLLQLRHLQGAFALLGAGLAVSLVALGGEWVSRQMATREVKTTRRRRAPGARTHLTWHI